MQYNKSKMRIILILNMILISDLYCGLIIYKEVTNLISPGIYLNRLLYKYPVSLL